MYLSFYCFIYTKYSSHLINTESVIDILYRQKFHYLPPPQCSILYLPIRISALMLIYLSESPGRERSLVSGRFSYRFSYEAVLLALLTSYLLVWFLICRVLLAYRRYSRTALWIGTIGCGSVIRS